MPPDPPLPIAATFFTVPQSLQVIFDQELQPNPALNVGNWSICDGVNVRSFVALAALGPVVSGPAHPVPGAPCGAPTVTFTPPPFDVLGPTGAPAAAFSIPMAVV